MCLSAIPIIILVLILLRISWIDWKTQEIPDGLILTGSLTGLIWIGLSWLFPVWGAITPILAGLGVLAGALPLLLIDRLALWILKKDAFGYGDVKLMGMAGLYLGPWLIFPAYFFAFVLAGGYSVLLIAVGKAGRGDYLAFGPFLSVGVLIAFFFGELFMYLILW